MKPVNPSADLQQAKEFQRRCQRFEAAALLAIRTQCPRQRKQADRLLAELTVEFAHATRAAEEAA